jgi:hypothetical protein
MPVRTAPAVLLTAAALVLAGCADLSADEQEAADNLAPALVSAQAGDAEQEASGCIAETWVGTVGTDALVDEKLLTAKLGVRRDQVRGLLDGERTTSREVAEGLADARLECADFDAVALDQKRDHPKASPEELDEYADCLKELDRDDWERSMVAYYTGSKADVSDFRRDLRACAVMLAETDG